MANPRIDDLRKRLDKEPGSRLFAQLAEELRKEGELEESIQVAREGLQKHPAYPSARMTLGRALLDTGDLAAARTEFEAVLKGAPDNILASRYLGECLEGLGDLVGAVARYKATLVLSPDDRQVLSRLEDVEGKLRKPSRGSTVPMAPAVVAAAAAADQEEPPPIPVAEVDEPMVLEAAYEAPTVRTGDAPAFDGAGQKAPPIREVIVEESFEVERSHEAPAPAAWRPEVFSPASEVVFEEEPPIPAPAPVEVLAVDEVFVDPEAAAEPERPPLSSSTLAELYFNQGFVAKCIEVYRQLVEREPGNERARARLTELEARDRHLRPEEGQGRPAAAPAAAPVSDPDPRARRREAIERTIQRLESFLAAVRRG